MHEGGTGSTTLTSEVLTFASLALPGQADTVRGALSELTRLNRPAPVEQFTCDFTQLQGNAYIHSSRWTFAFPAAEQGKTYQRQNSDGDVLFIREGKYTLTVDQSGARPLKPDSR